MKRCLVTGGAGFIGSHIIEELLREGFAVRVVDNLSNGKLANINHLLAEIEFIEGDLRDAGVAKRVVQGCDYVINQAALISVWQSLVEPALYFNNNVQTTLNVLTAAREAGITRVVSASSASIYGSNDRLPLLEEYSPEPLSPYAVTKAVDELNCRMFYRLYGLETVCLRYFNVYGPRQDPTSDYAGVISKFMSRMNSGSHPVIFGDGLQGRDFIYVGDVARANVLALKAASVAGEVVNVACGQMINLNELVAIINSLLGTGFKPEYQPERTGDLKYSRADISRAREVIKFQPRYEMKEGLLHTLRWLASNASN